jgi:hypothetical protein
MWFSISTLLLTLQFFALDAPSEHHPVLNNSGDTGETGDVIVDSFRSIGSVNSLLIEMNGTMLMEHYFGSMNAGRATNTKSASKSILSLLIGIAIDKGYIDSVDQTIDEFFPEYFESGSAPVKASITIKDLLTMRSGLATTRMPRQRSGRAGRATGTSSAAPTRTTPTPPRNCTTSR